MLSGTNGTNSLSGFSQRYNNLVQFNYSRQQRQKIYGERNDLNGCLEYIIEAFNSFNITLILVCIALLAIKGYNLQTQNNWNYFPKVCVPDEGCARVSRSFNHRDDIVIKNNVFTVSGLNQQVLENTLALCLDEGTTIYNSASYDEPMNKLSHTLFVSPVLGFVDDMYVEIVDCSKNKQLYSFNIQSSIRMGQSDFGTSSRRVAAIYQCLADNISADRITSKGRVC